MIYLNPGYWASDQNGDGAYPGVWGWMGNTGGLMW